MTTGALGMDQSRGDQTSSNGALCHTVRVAKDEGVVAVKSLISSDKYEDAGQALSRRGEWPS